MWNYLDQRWATHDPEFAADDIDPDHAAGPWSGHRRFGYDLIRNGRPGRIVELGTHYGVSFFAFCQAVLDGATGSDVHAVDTWRGDEHAGFYGDEVLEVVEKVRGECYHSVPITLHRMTFDDALAGVEDGSVDLLHIDGYHTYEAVSHDYESWVVKVAPNGVVLFHDVAPSSGYGSADFWAELRQRAPSITFPHSFGLGVLFPHGVTGHSRLFDENLDLLVRFYTAAAEADLRNLQVPHMERMIDERDQLIVTQTAMIDERDQLLVAQAQVIEERNNTIAELAARTEAVDVRNQELFAIVEDLTADAAASPLRRAFRPVQRAFRSAAPHLPQPVVTTAVRAKRRLLAGPVPHDHLHPNFRIVFDERFYGRLAGDIGPGISLLDHYLRFGWKRGLDPHPLFTVEWYLDQAPDVRSTGQEPLDHYLTEGWLLGLDPCPWFSSSWYRQQAAARGVEAVNPLVHFLTDGFRSGMSISEAHAAGLTGVRAMRDSRDPTRFATLLEPGRPTRQIPLAMAADLDAHLVTVDLWDTLVARTRPADSAKVATARRMVAALGPTSQRTAWEWFEARVTVEARIAARSDHEEYELVDVLIATLGEAGCDADVARPIALSLAESEIADEVAATVPIAETVALVNRFLDQPDAPTVIVLSDFYIGAKGLHAVLRKNGVEIPVDNVLVSCEIGASKRLGTAFDVARRRVGVERERHIHIGDNTDADGARAVASGCRALVVDCDRGPFPGPGALTPDWYRELPRLLGADNGAVIKAAGSAARHAPAIRTAYSTGGELAILAVAHVAAAIECATMHGVGVVHYASREGAFLARVHREIATIVATGDAPRAIHLEVSRRSTFAASLVDLSRRSLERMWRQYRDQSMGGLLTSIGVEPTSLGADLAAIDLDVDTVIKDIASSDQVRQFLERPRVEQQILEHASSQRALLLDYLDDREFGAERAVLVDIGWRGTIQDNLCAVRPRTEVHGVYLGLFPYLNPQGPNGSKLAVAFDGNLGDAYAFADPPAVIEAPFTPPGVPTAVSYERFDGGVRARVLDEPGRADELVDSFQAGVLEAAPRVARSYVSVGATRDLLRPGLVQMLERLYEAPPPGLADIWFESAHDDTFGVLNATPYAKPQVSAELLGFDGPMESTPEAVATRWPAGFAQWLPVRSLDVVRRLRQGS
jgi:FMN phosphatase YigB (HAD superfamily)